MVSSVRTFSLLMAVTIKSTSVSVSFCLSQKSRLLQVNAETVDVCVFVVVDSFELEEAAEV